MKQNGNRRILWLARDDGYRPAWYAAVPAPTNPVWAAQRDYLVTAFWLPAMRSLFISHGAWSEVVVAHSIRLQKRIQETIHVTRKDRKTVAIIGWVNFNLTEDDKAEITAAEVSVETMLQDIGSLVFKGYRFSMSFDDYSNALQASLVCVNEEDPNCGYAMSARHPDAEMTLRTLMYKFMACSDGPWADRVNERPAPGWS